MFTTLYDAMDCMTTVWWGLVLATLSVLWMWVEAEIARKG